MRPCCSHRSFLWFVFLLGAGSLPLLLKLEDISNPILHLRAGVRTRQPEEEVSNAPAAGLVSSLMLNDSKWSTVAPPAGSQEEVQQRTQEVQQRTQEVQQRTQEVQQRTQEVQQRTQELRRRLLDDVCSKYMPGSLEQVISRNHLDMVWVEDQSRLLYCEVPKAGCSNWKRVLMVLAGYADSALDIPHDIVHFHNQLPHLSSFHLDGVLERISTHTKFLFVRDPFERLVSAFRDKFENPNLYYHTVFGRAIISRYRANASQSALISGDGVTFREFVQYLLDPGRPVGMDIHWERVGLLCHPCMLRFDFIGKFENMNSEANFLLRSIEAPPHVVFPDYKDRNPQDERTSSTIMRRYFSQLDAAERQRVYDFYRMDYLMFNYSKPLPHLL